MPDARLFDSRELRRTLGKFVTGITVVTTIDEEGRFHGVTANSFSSVSLDPEYAEHDMLGIGRTIASFDQ
jgi:flavin reductase (DIM6/NTAB) family NADH-FMN oxidoreductase RutF